AKLACSAEAALVYMGHGNEHFPSAGSYVELAHRMRALYPDMLTLIGNVEGFPAIADVIADLKHYGAQKVLLKPFMIVAGDHSVNDMAGPEEDSWRSVLEKEGFDVCAVERGLGEIDAFAELFVRNAGEAAADVGISLK
ncbi:sirohydrochlorin cobaltochelatase, partial [Desulfobulbus sp. F4]|nr:sirohydrochlorin cobaltochelatase [Desulfobulbus sp. F4]